MDSKQIVKKVRAEPLKKNFTFSLSEEVVNEFQNACKKEKVSMSSVIEQMMKEFLASLKK